MSASVQVRSIDLYGDTAYTAFSLWEFLENMYIASNEQAIQNTRVKLDSLTYTDGTDWDEHFNKFNSLFAQLAMQTVAIDNRQKKSM